MGQAAGGGRSPRLMGRPRLRRELSNLWFGGSQPAGLAAAWPAGQSTRQSTSRPAATPLTMAAAAAAAASAPRLPLGKKVGIVGGGQLGRMLIQAAHPLGLQAGVVDPGGDSCASACMAQITIKGGLKDEDACAALAAWVGEEGPLTLEIEHVNAEALANLAKKGANVQPSPESVRIIQDKLLQKQAFREAGVKVPVRALPRTLQSWGDADSYGESATLMGSRRLPP
eukprot:SAG31_NODE_3108_length_4666_cov_2.823336_4_plen_227_part_00